MCKGSKNNNKDKFGNAKQEKRNLCKGGTFLAEKLRPFNLDRKLVIYNFVIHVIMCRYIFMIRFGLGEFFFPRKKEEKKHFLVLFCFFFSL